MKETLTNILNDFLRKNLIQIDFKELAFQIQSHPTYPSLHAITGVLDHFGIKHLAVELPQNRDSLDQLPPIFMAFLSGRGGEGFAVVQKNGDTFMLSYGQGKAKAVDMDTFIEVWSGVVLIVEKEPVNLKAPTGDKVSYRLAYLASGIAFLHIVYQQPSFYNVLYLLLSLVGVALSILTIQQGLGAGSQHLKRFCGGSEGRNGCEAVLSSKGSQVLGHFKLSQLAVVYFFTSVVYITFPSRDGKDTLLALISIIILPISFYSFYYQYKVVGQWCALCLSMAGVLVLQSLWAVFNLYLFNNAPIMIGDVLYFGALFFTLLAFWLIIEPKIMDGQSYQKLNIEYLRFKRNFNLFKASLLMSTKVEAFFKVPEIVFGQSGAPLSIVIVTNPACGHCIEVHSLLEKLIDKYQSQLEIIIRFYVNVEDEDNEVAQVCAKLMELFHRDGAEACLLAMRQVYGKMTIEDWLDKYGKNQEVGHFETLVAHRNWCIANEINFTPAILINGQAFPDEYNRSDLIFFIDDLLEETIDLAEVGYP